MFIGFFMMPYFFPFPSSGLAPTVKFPIRGVIVPSNWLVVNITPIVYHWDFQNSSLCDIASLQFVSVPSLFFRWNELDGQGGSYPGIWVFFIKVFVFVVELEILFVFLHSESRAAKSKILPLDCPVFCSCQAWSVNFFALLNFESIFGMVKQLNSRTGFFIFKSKLWWRNMSLYFLMKV